MPTYPATTSDVNSRMPHLREGFTLIELIVVIGIISVIAAIALPNLAPLIAFSGHDGAARRLANYGRAVMDRSALEHERMTVMVDLDNQEYWTERWRKPDSDHGESPEEEKELIDVTEIAAIERLRNALATANDETRRKSVEEHGIALTVRMNERARSMLQTKAERVEHDIDGVLGDIDPLFDEAFTLDRKKDELEAEELRLPNLLHTTLPDGLFIESLHIGDEEYVQGTVAVEITPLGLEAPVKFTLVTEQGDVLEVTWNPVTGLGEVSEQSTALQP